MKVTTPGFVYQEIRSYSGLTDYQWFRFRTEMDGYAFIGECELTFEMPEGFDPNAKKVEALKAQKKKAMADFQALVTDIDRQISELTAIEFVDADVFA